MAKLSDAFDPELCEELTGYTFRDVIAMYEDYERMAKEQTKCAICNGGLPCDNGCDGFCDICDIPDVFKTIHKTGQYNYCPICGRALR